MIPNKPNDDTPPVEWVECTIDFDEVLAQLHMQWRRGGGLYRPLTHAGPANAEGSPPYSRSVMELKATNIPWPREPGATREQRHQQIVFEIGKLWAVAVDWTQSLGGWCDFKLTGYDADGNVLFESGKRCKLKSDSGESIESSYDSTPMSDLGNYHRYREAEQHVNARTHSILDKMIEDRDKLFDQSHRSLREARDTMSVMPELLGHAGSLFSATFGQYEKLLDRRYSDAADLAAARADAIREIEKGGRLRTAAQFGVEVMNTGADLLKAYKSVASDFIHMQMNKSEPAPKRESFERAQQAMALIQWSLRPSRLKVMFKDKPNAVGAFMAYLDRAARTRDERQALALLGPIMPAINDEPFDQVATPAMLDARDYILHRLAIHNLPYYGDEGDEDQN